jgi:hypothetical protein
MISANGQLDSNALLSWFFFGGGWCDVLDVHSRWPYIFITFFLINDAICCI